jgi:hypothetical protein
MATHLVKCSLPLGSYRSPTCPKFSNSKFFICVDAFSVVTKSCGNPTLIYTLLRTIDFRVKWWRQKPNSVTKAMRTQIATNAFDDIINRCSKLMTSLIGCANLELQSSEIFNDCGILSKVINDAPPTLWWIQLHVQRWKHQKEKELGHAPSLITLSG